MINTIPATIAADKTRLRPDGVAPADIHVSSTTTILSQPRLDGKARSYDLAGLGAVYTPPVLAKWVASKLIAHCPSSPLTVLDPACGDGALLSAIAQLAGPSWRLMGADMDPEALDRARTILPADTHLVHLDALVPQSSVGPAQGWRQALGQAEVNAVIANPPWGATIRHSRAALRSAGYVLANGQYDSYELFVEVSLKVACRNGVLAFIIPDSLFLPEHTPLRRLLLEQTQLLLIARLGEGWFPGVYRGTTVIVFRKEAPQASHTVECLRLPSFWRKRILAGNASLEQAEAELIHSVPQSRFACSGDLRFDIDLRNEEHATIQVIQSTPMPWDRWLVSRRGIELSKHGRVVLCPSCGTARPRPRERQYVRCEGCGKTFRLGPTLERQITRPMGMGEAGWRPVIVGEDVDRYSCAPSRQIRVDIPGIAYKSPQAYTCRKIVIRKTGVGIKAAIDESGSYTNQVVFHLSVKPGLAAPPFLLDYVLGVLCSRVLLAYHLKRFGENEWRSHPYITQKIISEFPLPDVLEDGWKSAQAQAIAHAVTTRRAVDDHNSPEDLLVEQLVAGIFGMDENDCIWVHNVLESAEALEPIRSLRLPNRTYLRPLRVS